MGERQKLFKFTAHQNTPKALYELEEWNAEIDRDPKNIDLRMTLCRVLARRGMYEEAIRHCEECLKVQPEGGQLTVSRRLRIVAMATRLKRASEKHKAKHGPISG